MKKRKHRITSCDEWLGGDFTIDMCSEKYARTSVNFIKSESGGIRKRNGIAPENTEYPDTVFAVHTYSANGGERRFVHTGRQLLCDGKVMSDSMAMQKSTSVQIGDRLYITDGEHFVYCDGDSVHSAGENPYIPLIYTHRKPEGKGEINENPNIFTKKVREGFISDGQSTQYVLSQTGLISDDIECTVYRDDGTSYTVTTGSGLSVNTDRGIVTFSSAPPLSRATDRDNVIITYTSYADMDVSVLNKCRCITAFGKGGAKDTLFLSGNEFYPGRVWYSHPDKPLYFSGDNMTDTQSGNVCGFSQQGDRLFIHSNVSRHKGCISVCAYDGDYCRIINVIDCPSVYENTIATPADKPFFLTERGIYSIGKNSASLDNLTQKEFAGIDGWLIKNDIQTPSAAAYNGQYIIAFGKHVFACESDMVWHLEFPVNVSGFFTESGKLKLVSDNGKIYAFTQGYDDVTDDIKPVKAVWQTGFVTGENMDIHSLTVYAKTHRFGDLSAVIIGDRQKHKTKNADTDFFFFDGLKFSSLNFAPPDNYRGIKLMTQIKNTDKFCIEFLSETGGCEIRKWMCDISEVKEC